MLRTVSWLALPGRALSAGFDGGISPPFQFVAAQLLGGWVPTETGLSPASHSRLLWTHEGFRTPAGLRGPASGPEPFATSISLLPLSLAVPAARPCRRARGAGFEIGRASCRARVKISVAAASLKKKNRPAG